MSARGLDPKTLTSLLPHVRRWRPALGLGAGAWLLGSALDLPARWEAVRAFSHRDWRVYAATALLSIAWWTCLALLLAAARSRRVAWAVGSVLGAVLLVPGAVLLVYGRVPTDDEARFFANEWLFCLKSAAAPGDARGAWLVLGMGGLLAAFCLVASRLQPTRRDAQAAAGLACVVAVVVTAAPIHRQGAFTADMSGVRFAGKIASWLGRPPPFFKMVERLPGELPAREMRHHVLWVVHETVGARYLRAPDGKPVAPALLALREDPSVVWLDRLHTVSSCTDVSMPSILSGISVAAGLPVQARAVLPFDVARRAGAFTFVSSAQELGWARMDRYLGREQFDAFRSAGDLGPSGGDDLGVPDELALAEALRQMDAAVAQGRRFAGLVRTNGTHGPYQVDPLDSPWTQDPGFAPSNPGAAVKYLNALHRLDREFGAFWKALSSRPWFDDVLVIVTADHGEAFGQHGLWWHCGAFYPEESHVPGALRLPASWRASHPDQERRLRSGATGTQFVTALAPTVGAILGWPELITQSSQRPLWEGPPVAPVVFTNCSDLRACVSKDLGLYDGARRWVRSAATGRWEAWDEAADPTALNELAPSLGGVPREALQRLEADPVQRDVVLRVLGHAQ